MIDFSVEGFNDINDMLADLQSILGKRASRAAARSAMQPVLKEVQNTAPYDALTQDGLHLRDHFKLSVTGRTKRDSNKGNDLFLRARVQTNNKEVEQYAALVEFGRAEHVQKRTNAYGIPTKPFNVLVKATKANPFMRPALRRHEDDVVRTFCNGLMTELDTIKANKSRIAKSKIKCMERKAKKRSQQ